jgi:hypothetical protein
MTLSGSLLLKMVCFLSLGGFGWELRWCSGCRGSFVFCFRFDEWRMVWFLSGRTLVSWCRWFADVSEVHPVAMRSAEFCTCCILSWFVFEMIGAQTVLAYSIVGLV